jgi:hypothetical protein
MTQNWFATFALLAWPLLSIWLYSTLPMRNATIWTVLGAQFLLPVGAVIKIPTIPQFDKSSIPCICIAIGCMIVSRQRLRLFGGFGLLEILIVLYLAVPLITSELNGDVLIFDYRVLPGVGLYDAISAVEAAFISLLPFFVARQFLWKSDTIKDMLRILVTAELFYTVPLLFEIRMSPQLHYWFYGYYPSDFIQSMRDGGFRPMVFMGHGLAATFFLMMAIVAGTTLWRLRVSLFRAPTGAIVSYLALVLILCKSLASLVYAATLAPLVKFATPRMQTIAATAIVMISLLYPTLRSLDLFPTQALLETARSLGPEREESLRVRFTNENKLLARALERPFFGWGRFGRSRIYNTQNGNDESITDGRWVITLGQFGIAGFIAEFGLLAIGVFRAALTLRLAKTLEERLLISSLSLIIAVNILDLLPNSGLLPWTWLMVGALVGRTEVLAAKWYRQSTPSHLTIKRSPSRQVISQSITSHNRTV